jgi:hypothetical protein
MWAIRLPYSNDDTGWCSAWRCEWERLRKQGQVSCLMPVGAFVLSFSLIGFRDSLSNSLHLEFPPNSGYKEKTV